MEPLCDGAAGRLLPQLLRRDHRVGHGDTGTPRSAFRLMVDAPRWEGWVGWAGGGFAKGEQGGCEATTLGQGSVTPLRLTAVAA